MAAEIEQETPARASNALVVVKHLALADETKTRWLNNMLASAVDACRFERVPGVRIIPLSKYAGRLDQLNYEWNIDLCISSGFWRKDGITLTYLHECAHLLVTKEERRRGNDTHVHGPVFFLINMVLLARLDALRDRPGNMFGCLKLYDFQSAPIDWPQSKWRGAVLEFALAHYSRLAISNLSAEAVAREAWNLWEIEREILLSNDQARIDEINEKSRLVNECNDLKAKVKELERQRAVSFGWGFLFMMGWSGLILPGSLILAVYTSLIGSIAYAIGLHRLL